MNTDIKVTRLIFFIEMQTTLFRTDSIATKTTRAYFKLIGSDYLKTTLRDVVTEVIQNSKNHEV